MDIINTEHSYNGNFINVIKNTFKLPNNEIKIIEKISRNSNNISVLIVPFHLETRQYILNYEFKFPINTSELTFTNCNINSKDTIAKDIQFYIKENIGLEVVEIKSISNSLYNYSDISDNTLYIAFVDVIGNLSSKNIETTNGTFELISPFFASKALIKDLLQDNSIIWNSHSWLLCNIICNTLKM